MFDAMKWLVKDAKKHDSLFFHCNTTSSSSLQLWLGFISFTLRCLFVDSGHGGQVKDETGKESDGMDEGML